MEDILDLLEHVAYPFDDGHEVHADVVVGDVCYSAVGMQPGHCVLKGERSLTYTTPQRGLEIVEIPVLDIDFARRYLDSAVSANVSYYIPVVDFVTPSPVLQWTDPDVDCCDQASWSTLFCSQFVLLFLRYLHTHSMLRVPGRQPSASMRCQALLACNSHVCSPTHLREILREVLGR